MRHRVANNHLGLPTDQRIAMLKNIIAGVLEHGHVTTTEARAKEARSVIEKVITLSREDSIHNRRQVRRYIHMGHVVKTREKYENIHGVEPSYEGELKGADRRPYGEVLLKKIFTEIGPRYKDRDGGYLRLTRLGGVSHNNKKGNLTIRPSRRGDGATMVKIELVD